MARIGDGHIIEAIHNRAFKDGDRLVEIGEYLFSGADETVEVPTELSAVELVLLCPKTVTYDADDQLSSDGVVSSDAVTVARNSSGGTDALAFYYMFIGRRWD